MSRLGLSKENLRYLTLSYGALKFTQHKPKLVTRCEKWDILG